jgi:hypothetical protein
MAVLGRRETKRVAKQFPDAYLLANGREGVRHQCCREPKADGSAANGGKRRLMPFIVEGLKRRWRLPPLRRGRTNGYRGGR